MKGQPAKHGTWRLFAHTADVGVAVTAPSRELLFRTGAMALFSLITDRRRVRPRERQRLRCEGGDPAEVWVNVLRSALDLFQGEGFLLRDLTVATLGSGAVTGTARGERFDPARHTLKREVKAVTYHQARMEQTRNGWIGRVVLDV